MFSEGPNAQTRDIMMLQHLDLWYGYYTGRIGGAKGVGQIWARTTPDFKTWSESVIVASAGIAGTGRAPPGIPGLPHRFSADWHNLPWISV